MHTLTPDPDSTPPPGAAPPEPLLIEPLARRVTLAGRVLALQDRALDLLLALASAPGQVFPAETLKATVWPGRVVQDQNLRMQVLALRKALGDAQAVLTIAGQGYQLALPVRWLQPRLPAGQVPVWPEPLLGREQDIAALRPLLAGHRLVTLLGPGGIGKTRLAQCMLLELQTLHPQGVWWVDLAPLQARGGAVTVVAVAQAMAQAMGLPAGSLRDAAAASQLGTMLAGWQALLLLDSAEHLAGANGALPPLVRTLLGAAPGLRVLVTSQQALGLTEEWVYRLDTLAVPEPDAPDDQALASPALQLLLRRARSADQAFELPAAELPAAAHVVRRLDGIALAIEMAAVRLPLLGAPALLQQLHTQLQPLGGHDAAAAPRQRTLRATLDWSHALLSPAEQQALRQLSVFAAPFRAGAAVQVVQGLGGDEAQALQQVQGLLDKSLLQRRAGSAHGVPVRLRLLESTRLFAADALAARPREWQGSRRLHAQAMAHLARLALSDFYTCSDDLWLARWLPDHADFALGFDHAHLLGDADSAADLIEILVRGAMITGQADWATERWAATRELAQTAAPLARAVLLGWGGYQVPAGQTRQALAAERVQVWRELKDPQRTCAALASLAVACEHEGDRAGADAALQACEDLEDPAWSPRLRLRCVLAALEGLAQQRDDPALHQRLHTCTRQLVPQLQALGAEVTLQSVQTRQLPLLCLQGAYDEALAVVQSMTASAASRHLHLSEAVFHGYGMVAWLGRADARLGLSETAAGARSAQTSPAGKAPAQPSAAAADLANARAAALRSLALLEAGPEQLRLFSAPLSWLAFRLGDPELAATLHAGGQRLQRSLQYATNRLESAFDARLAPALKDHLDAESLGRARAAGERLTPNSLRQWVLQRLAALPAEPERIKPRGRR